MFTVDDNANNKEYVDWVESIRQQEFYKLVKEYINCRSKLESIGIKVELHTLQFIENIEEWGRKSIICIDICENHSIQYCVTKWDNKINTSLLDEINSLLLIDQIKDESLALTNCFGQYDKFTSKISIAVNRFIILRGVLDTGVTVYFILNSFTNLQEKTSEAIYDLVRSALLIKFNRDVANLIMWYYK